MIRLVFILMILLTAFPETAWTAAETDLKLKARCLNVSRVVTVLVEARNDGQEEVRNLAVTARVGQASKTSPVDRILKPGRKRTFRLRLHPDITLPGTYPVRVGATFEDQAGRIGRQAGHALFHYERPAEFPAAPSKASGETSERGSSIFFELSNPDQKSRLFRVELFPAGASETESIIRTVTVEGEGSARASFDLPQRQPAGSRLPVVAFFEYESEGRHFASVFDGAVAFASAAEPGRDWIMIAGALIALLVLAWLLARAFRRTGPRRADS